MRNIYIQFQEGGMWRNCMTLTEGASSQRILMDLSIEQIEALKEALT